MLSAKPVDPSIECRSLAEESWIEALRERWYQSERAGRDVGDCAIHYWVHYHWPGFLRARWIEHMQGKRFWIELSRDDFGILSDTPVDLRPLLDSIVDQLKCGAENLDIIRWGKNMCSAERAALHKLLTAINVNANRMKCFFANA